MKKVLVAALHWGLGHATRCVPIIECLKENGFEVIIASDGSALNLLQAAFPELTAVELPPYRITYRSENMFLNVARMLPGILSAVREENKVTRRMVKEYGIDVIISDNRYGCYSPKCTNIFVTHQVNIQTGNALSDLIIRNFNKARIGRFDQLWIPDVEGDSSLSGILSHHFGKITVPVRYTGILSRFKKCTEYRRQGVLVILSGPEPQRTIFEELVMKQSVQMDGQVTVVRGQVSGEITKSIKSNITVYNYADGILLNELVCSSAVVVARSGYSTLMDLAVTGSKALLVPTPGQSEQIYLAKQLGEQGVFEFQEQKNLDLQTGIARAMDRKKPDISAENRLNELVKLLLKQ